MAFGHEPPQPDHRPPEPDLAGGPGKPRRALVPVGMLMRPLYALADSIGAVFAMIWRVIRRLLERIAGRRDVQLEAPTRPPGGVGESAAFLGDNAADAAKDASEGIQELVEEASQIVQGQGAEAYLKLTMERLGAQLVAERALLQTQQGRLREAAAPVSSRLGVDPDELTALLTRERVDEATLAMDAALTLLREMARTAQATSGRLDNLRSRFVDYCEAAARHGDQNARARFEAIILDALQSAGDPALNDAAAASLARLRSGEAAIEGEREEEQATQTEQATSAAVRGRFSVSAGEAGLGDDDTGAQPADLSRVPLPPRQAVDFEFLEQVPAQTDVDPMRQRA
ncbi:MAG TPA: hypothetical protein VN259_09080 [Xanthomonadales bacterium]|nr:hypothetical protein [Xanthomonadales bacterium]